MTVKVTPFGQYVRKLRVDHDEFGKDMALRLGISAEYLSAVERGLRNCPYDWAERLYQAYELPDDELVVLTKAISDSRWYDRLDVSHLVFSQKRLMADLAEQLPDMSEEKIEQIRALIN